MQFTHLSLLILPLLIDRGSAIPMAFRLGAPFRPTTTDYGSDLIAPRSYPDPPLTSGWPFPKTNCKATG